MKSVYEVICVDFDGTLVEHRFPEIGRPKDAVIEWVKQHQKLGTKLILWTCREDHPSRAYLAEAVTYCQEMLGITFDAVNENIEKNRNLCFATRKPLADVYLDDRAINVEYLDNLNK